MKTLVRLVLFSLVLGLFGCGSGSNVQKPDNPTPPPAKGPQSASTPTTGGGQEPGRLELGALCAYGTDGPKGRWVVQARRSAASSCPL